MCVNSSDDKSRRRAEATADFNRKKATVVDTAVKEAVSKVTPAQTPASVKGSEEANAGQQAAQAKEAEALRRNKGRNSTIRTGALGLTDNANIQRKTLLGG